ncbi:MAG: efflux RND transporter periplasmic adaptor subunit [Hydrogenovibrio sp.]
MALTKTTFLLFGCLSVCSAGVLAADTASKESQSKTTAKNTAKPQRPLPSVVVQAVTTENVAPVIKQSGRVVAIDTVQLRARVEGFLTRRNFVEGARVSKGDVLFNIEKDTYQIALKERQADLLSAKATLKNAEADLVRKKDMLPKHLISQSDVDQAEAARDTARAQVMLSEAAVEQARLNLSYTDVVAPQAGVVGIATYSTGNLVNAASQPLATITSIDPVYVTVEIGEKKLLEAQSLKLKNKSSEGQLKAIPTLILSDGSKYTHSGEFNYLAPEVDMTSNTVTLRASFPNPDYLLRPGQYVTVSITSSTPDIKVVVPQESVQKDKDGYFVLVVDDQNAVQNRRVDLGRQLGENWVVKSGLKQGEKVIVQGLQKVKPNMKVNVVDHQGAAQ